MLRSLVVLALCAPLAAAQPFTQKPEVAPSVVVGDAPKPPDASGAKLFAAGPTPLWVWGADNNKRYTLTKTFAAPNVKTAVLKVSADNHVKLSLNGKQVAASDEWKDPGEADVSKLLKPEGNVLSAEVRNDGGVAGFVFKLAMTTEDGKTTYVVSDETWTTDGKVKKVGTLGDAPWGNVFDTGGGSSKVAANTFVLQPGFRVTKLFSVPKDKLGSWVCLTHDDQGRLIASDQGDKGLVRITPPKSEGDETKVERIPAKITAAQGLLWHNGGLYVVCNGGPGSGLYRVTSSKNDDMLDTVTKLKALPGGGEHGPHAIRLAPDRGSLYVICGNHTKPPEGFDHSRLPKNWAEDHLLPRMWDAGGHAVGVMAPGGYVAQTTFDGKHWDIFTAGYRNPYDFAFNADGEMFVYDADMEWDMGMPWYRPTRVNHATGGSELGWRSGSGKWPSYYPDSLPAMVDIGPGSPVGVEFGYGAKFPAKFQKALYVCDWTFGTMYAVHTTPSGSTYTATKEEFLSRTPLPLTDVCVNPHDGMMYFTIGGRGANSELYRVEYVGTEPTEKAPAEVRAVSPDAPRNVRVRLERLHYLSEDPASAVEFALSRLGDRDRFIRYAARVALEHQPLKFWQDKVLALEQPTAVSNGIVALAHQGDKTVQPKLLAALAQLDLSKIPEPQQLELLRAYQLVFTRMGEPSTDDAAALLKKLDPLFPAKSDDVNRELVQLLIYLKSPTVLAQTIALLKEPSKPLTQAGLEEVLLRNRGYGGGIQKMLANAPDLQKLHYAFVLRNVKTPWTLDQYRVYFESLKEARSKSGGASYQGFINNMEKDAFANATDESRLAIEAAGLRTPYKPKALPKAIGPGRDWTTADLVALEPKLKGRNFKAGQAAFAAARCVVCHRVGGDGGATGPDLSQVAGRFGVKDLAEAIVEPSKVVSDQYKASIVRTGAGKTLTGKLLGEENGKLRILTDPEDSTKITEVAKGDVEEVKPSAVSLMPADLLKPLNESEVLDMLAYMLSRGDPGHPMFRK